MKKTLTTLASSLLFSSILLGDPILEEIEVAKKAYNAGEFTEAQGALQQASVLVLEKKAEYLKKAFSDKLGEWVGKKIENQSAGLAVFGGGGLMLKRSYEKGGGYCSLEIAVDSPLMAQFSMIFNNPAMAAQMGAKVRRVNGGKVVINEEEGSILQIVDNRFYVKIQGNGLKEAELIEMLKGVDASVFKDFR